MRRESSTVVALVGELGDIVLAELGRSANVAVVRVTPARAGQPAGERARPAWDEAEEAMRQAGRQQAGYVIVPADPLAEVAAAWRAMWVVAPELDRAVIFEERAAEVLAAWRAKRFDLPDYYLVIGDAKPDETSPDLYLGPMRAVRPRRVAFAGLADDPAQASRVLDTLKSFEHGPWWPPLDELIDVARNFYAGGLTRTQAAAL